MNAKKPYSSSRLKIAVATLTLAISSISFAELVSVPSEGAIRVKSSNIAVPSRSVTKSYVESKFGEPLSKSGPVGEPAIYSWRYGQFTVYFENDKVIHTVTTSG